MVGIIRTATVEASTIMVPGGLRIWETGYQVVCSPFAEVTHLSSLKLSEDDLVPGTLFRRYRRNFESEWFTSGRLDSLEKKGFEVKKAFAGSALISVISSFKR